MVIVRSLVSMYTNFRSNRTIFWPCFGPESHAKASSNPKFWYFYSLIISRKWAEFEKNRWLHSMGWFYTVALILGWSLTAVWVHWNQKYFGKFTYPNISLMGQSFIKIPDFVSETIFMTWKMCLLRKVFMVTTNQVNRNVFVIFGKSTGIHCM